MAFSNLFSLFYFIASSELLHQWDWCIEAGRPTSILLLQVEDNRHQSFLLDFGFESPHNLQAIGSARGLICYVGVQVPQSLISKFIIFNPEIKSFLSVPPPLPFIQCSSVIKGFGFEDTTLDSKIILACNNGYVYLYSLNSNSWKFISCQISWGHVPGGCAIFVKDCFHWLTYENFQTSFLAGTYPDRNPCILVFDIKAETFRRILFPEHLLGRLQIIAGFDESSIGVVQILERTGSTLTHVWLMDQNGLWFKIADVKVDKRNEGKEVLGFRNKDELIIKLFKRSVIVSQSIKDKVVHHVVSLELQDLQGRIQKVHTHVPSLALLDKMVA